MCGPHVPAQLENVSDAGGAEQRGAALALDHRVGDQGRRMGEPDGMTGIGLDITLERGKAGEHRDRRVVRGGQPLGAADFAACLIEEHEIREGAADVASRPKRCHPPNRSDAANSIASGPLLYIVFEITVSEFAMSVDRFGNAHAPDLSYARGKILAGTEDDFQKLQLAWSLIRQRGPRNIYIFTGLEHAMPLAAEELEFADDEIGPALSFDRLKALALDHLGGSPETDDVAVFNRLTGATLATRLTLVKPGDVVIRVSETHSHPSVVRAANHAGSRFIDTAGLAAFRDAIATEKPSLVVLTRLAVTYDLMSVDAIRTVVRLAHDKGALVYVDDAGGARVGPAAFDQPRMLELGVDIGAPASTNGTVGPRFGLLGGSAASGPRGSSSAWRPARPCIRRW